uniref:HLA class I histocompatibility antigen, B alpha chain-like n=1 Tax=Ictidomys tridecemlineatus TaxID=43179 RepID=UPI001A9DEA7B|nr:HLA class I histocompatibility antigen, B alpha chain-like [Ictidomys tridecemlineatus]
MSESRETPKTREHRGASLGNDTSSAPSQSTTMAPRKQTKEGTKGQGKSGVPTPSANPQSLPIQKHQSSPQRTSKTKGITSGPAVPGTSRRSESPDLLSDLMSAFGAWCSSSQQLLLLLLGGEPGSHFLQETWGCKIHKDNRTRAFWNFYYDGKPFLSYHPETLSWKVEPPSAQNLAMEVKNSWDADGMQSKDYWAQVQGELCGRLRRYLVFWKDSSYSSGASAQRTLLSPAVNVTCAEALEDTINVTCWAFGFYPENISVTWLQDGEPLCQDAQQAGGIFSYENGTYQTWVSTRIPQGLEQGFSCHVGHSGNNSTGFVSCGKPGNPRSGSQPGTALLLPNQWVAFLGVAAAVVAVIMIIVCVCSCKKRKTECTSEGSGEKSVQWLGIAGPIWNVESLVPPAAQTAVEVTSFLEKRMEFCLQPHPLVFPKARAVNISEGPDAASVSAGDPSKGVSPVGDLDCDHDNAMGQMIDGPTVHTAESQENPSFLWKEDL